MMSEIHSIAEQMIVQIRAMGGDPEDHTVVTNYIKGCNIPSLIAKAIEETIDGE